MKKTGIFILKIAIAVLIISFLIHRHYDSFAQNIRNFNFIWLIPALAILYLEMIFCSLRWYCLVKSVNITLSFKEALSLTMRGYFCSLIIPGGAIGGDVAKIGMIAHGMNKGERFEPSLSILIDRISGMIALFGTALVLIILDFRTLMNINLTNAHIPQKYNLYLILFVMLLCIAGIAAASVLFCHRFIEKVTFFKFIINKFDQFSDNLIGRMKQAIDLYLGQWKTLLLATTGSVFLVHLIQLPILCCICYGLNMPIPSYLTLASAIIIGNIAGLIPLTPGGIGLRDLTIFTILQAGGFENVTIIPLLLSLVLLIGNVSAGIFFFDKGIDRSIHKNEIIKDTCNI